jgi:HD superfamily phosphohydrolase YqeK
MSAQTGSALLHDAAAGRLPGWAVLGADRRAHAERVAALMDAWAAALGVDDAERVRWRAVAWLHDALRDAVDEELRPLVPEPLRLLPTPLLHGPAAARRLADDGVADEALLLAVAFHTLGHPGLDTLGRALYAADYLEPGRDFRVDERAAQRARMPGALDAVLVEIVSARVTHLLEERRPIRAETLAFWNALIAEQTGARAP